ncbi:MAG: ATP-binding cassette domain-containing protein [Desulfovibrio sp.]|nr:ATP-binding cassette domain-containing protein [Desulfovibrio sp.]
MQHLVDITHVTLFLPGDARQIPVLHDITWSVLRGEHCALLGPNGSGKSTLLRLLRGELWPAQGHIRWHGPQGADESPLTGRAMTALVSPLQQAVYQRRAWDLTGRDLLLTAFDDTPLLYSQANSEQDDAAEAMAYKLQASGLLARQAAELSQGQLRLLLLGRALLRRPALLLLDECDDGLDPKHRRIFFTILEEYASHSTVIMCTHKPGQLPSWCAGRRYMHDGRLWKSGTTTQQATPPGNAGTVRALDNARRVTPADHSPLLELADVTVFINRKKVLDNITWSLHRGEHWRISGANGSGKSTLLRLLAGDEFVADGGRLLRFLTSQGGGTHSLEAVRRGIRLVSDLSQSLYGYDLNVLDMVCTGFDNSIGVYRCFSQHERGQARAALALLFPEYRPEALTRLEGESIRRLSTGQLRRLFLARSLMGDPEILLLDEPCSGLDSEVRTSYLNLVDNLADQSLSIVYVCHDEDDAPLCINREARMEGGRLRVVR